MATTYELRVHYRDVVIGTDIGNHTGYSLIEYEDGVAKKVHTVDLWNDWFDVNFNISTSNANTFKIGEYPDGSDKTIIWGEQTWDDGQFEYTNEQYLVSNKAGELKLIGQTDSMAALAAFNKIKLHAQVLKQFSDDIVYYLTDRNCNSATQYFNELYLGNRSIFPQLPGVYAGWEHDFTEDKIGMVTLTDPDVVKAAAIVDSLISLEAMDAFENFLDSVPVDFDWNGFEITGYGSGYFVFSDGINSYEVYEGSVGRYIQGDGGNNNLIGTGGNDVIYGCGGKDYIYGGKGDDYIDTSMYAGNDEVGDYLYGGSGNDNINGGDGADYLYGEVGNDKLRGYHGNDYLYGGYSLAA